MNIGDLNIALWVLDWSGSICVVISLVYLFEKRLAYWHWSNVSLIPYTALFVSTRDYLLAGLQVSYLVFGLHGLRLWMLQHRRDASRQPFNERRWLALGWVLVLAIFTYTTVVTEFIDGWAWLQFAIVVTALIANWGTTRKQVWSWPLWMVVNVAQFVYFAHGRLWGQMALQPALFAMSVHGWFVWRTAARAEPLRLFPAAA
jgi:nicotinamide mononucleotide transporter